MSKIETSCHANWWHITTLPHAWIWLYRVYSKSFTRSKTPIGESGVNTDDIILHNLHNTHKSLLARCIRNTVSLKLPPKMVRVISWWSLLNTFHLHLVFSLSDQLCYQSKQMKWPSVNRTKYAQFGYKSQNESYRYPHNPVHKYIFPDFKVGENYNSIRRCGAENKPISINTCWGWDCCRSSAFRWQHKLQVGEAEEQLKDEESRSMGFWVNWE